MELSDRIAAIIKVNQHTAASFADAIGVQRSSLSHILNGRNKPSIDFLEKVLLHFPRVDAGWLITGKHPLKTDAPMVNLKKSGHDKGQDEGPEAPLAQETPLPAAALANTGAKTIERIVVFYTDRTFDAYDANNNKESGPA